MGIDSLIEELREIDPAYGIVLDLICAGYEKKEIADRLKQQYSQSQAYKKIKDARAKAYEVYYGD